MRREEEQQVETFLDGVTPRPTLAIVSGRRRIGKSTMLVRQVAERRGFYFEATEVTAKTLLERLGAALGEFVGVPRLALDDWATAVAELVRLGERGRIPVVLDEFGYVVGADPSVPSEIARAFGPAATAGTRSTTRLVLCGSAIAVMRALAEGESALRGRAGLELAMRPDDFRVAVTRLPNPGDLETALHTFAVVGGVVGYATDMVDFDLPGSMPDFGRWIAQRVLHPAATLHHEAATLLAEDPATSGRNSLLSNSLLASIANGSVTVANLSRSVGRQIPNIIKQLGRLCEAGFVVRHEDPVRDQRTLYALDDPFLQFHFAVIEPHGQLLRDRDIARTWTDRLLQVYRSRVLGPVFEEMARTWTRRFASDETLPVRDWIGPSSVGLDGKDRQIDVLVADDSGDVPAERAVAAIGEAKSGETLTLGHLSTLERMRAAFGERALGAKLFLFGTDIDSALRAVGERRDDVELIDLDRLYHGC